jgi:hypothetical protein
MTPFGAPVDPDVNTMYASDDGGTVSEGIAEERRGRCDGSRDMAEDGGEEEGWDGEEAVEEDEGFGGDVDEYEGDGATEIGNSSSTLSSNRIISLFKSSPTSSSKLSTRTPPSFLLALSLSFSHTLSFSLSPFHWTRESAASACDDVVRMVLVSEMSRILWRYDIGYEGSSGT